jgi:hypothetical protein
MRLVQHRRLLVLLLAQALTSAVAAHDDVRRVAVGETLRRSGYESTPRRAQRSRLYPRNAGYIQQLPTGSGFRPAPHPFGLSAADSIPLSRFI